jgi:DNA-directed RNA polymerase specialized sigma24 family protein
VQLDDVPDDTVSAGLSDLDDALTKLKSAEPNAAEVFELKYYGGRSHPQVAEILDLSEATVRRRWGVACAVLRVQLRGANAALTRRPALEGGEVA